MYRVGIVGCGSAGARQYRTVTADGRATVAACADPDPERRGGVAEWDVETHDAVDALLAEADVDGVVVTLPLGSRPDAVVSAAEAGVDVLCASPFAPDLDAADRVLDAVEGMGVALHVAEAARYEPWTRAVEALLDEGAVGRPVFGRYDRLADADSAFGPASGSEFDRASGGGSDRIPDGGFDRAAERDRSTDGGRASDRWLAEGVPLVSVLRGWWRAAGGGDVEAVSARRVDGSVVGSEGACDASVQLQFEDGTTATANIGDGVPRCGEFDEIRIRGTDGTVAVPRERTQVNQYDPSGPREPVIVESERDALAAQFARFVDYAEERAAPRTSGVRERDTLAVVEAGYESMATGETVGVDLRGR